MIVFLTVVLTLFILGSINFFIVLLKHITGITKAEEIYVNWTIGFGWIWILIVLPIYRLIKFILMKMR